MIDAPTGTLHELNGCISLAAEGRQFRIYWPPGYSAESAPLRVYNGNGVAVAREGDQIRFALRDQGEADACGRSGTVVVSFGQEPATPT